MKKLSSFLFICLIFLGFLKMGCTDITNGLPPEIDHIIKSVIPAQGPLGSRIEINGQGFGSDSNRVRLYFDDIRAAIESISDTTILTRVPMNAKTGHVVIILEDDTLSGPTFTVDTTRTLFLHINDVHPRESFAGDEIAISGTGFQTIPQQNTVLFGTAPATVTSAMDTLLKATVPENAQTGNVMVIVDEDTARGPVFTVLHYRSLQVSTETNGTPAIGDSFTISVSGRENRSIGFNDQIKFNEILDDQVQVKLSKVAENCTVEGDNPREVNLPPNERTQTTFSIQCARLAPIIGDVTPISGTVGTQVTITGQNFSSTAVDNKVTFNGTAADVSSASETKLITRVPDGATNGPIKVTIDGKTAIGPTFTVEAKAPVISSVNPQSGVIGTEVTITGKNFSDKASEDKITFNGTAASVSSASETKLVTHVPEGASSGPIKVKVGEKSGTGPTFTVITKGKLKVEITTSGSSQDENGYLLSVDDSEASRTNLNETVTRSVLERGEHKVELSDIAANCMLINNTSNPRTVNIEAGETTTTSYDIQCETPNQPPVASITYECKNLRCSFDGSGSTDSDGSLQTYAWSFGDKGSGKGTQVSHTYETAGIYTIKLTVTDDDGANGSAGKDVKVTLPKVSGLSPDSGPRGTEVTINGTNFSSNASDDQVQFTSGSGKVGATIKSALETQLVVDVPADATDGPIYVTVYDYTVKGPAFDVVTTGTIEVNITTDGVSQDEDGYLLSIDGSEGVRTKINDIITKDGLSQGSHQVGLSDLASNCYITQDRSNPYSVDVSAGKTTNTQIDIHCEEPNRPPTADFTYSCENLSCNFDGSGSSDQETAIQDYIWDFGDGRTSNGKTISHNFETAGTYTVELKVTDYDDASGSVTKDVTVSLPKIDSISPNSGPVGTEVTINGSGFSAEKTNDTVSFTSGGSEVNATIKSASETQVVVDVPSDATSGPVYVSTYGYRVQGPVFNVQQPGDLRVTTTIEGTQRDSDGYMVTVSDEGSKSILNQGSVTFNDITQNSVQVELTGVAANCRVDGENPRTVSIPSGDITGTTFNVDCTQDLKGQIIFVSNRTGNNDIFSQDANSNIPRQITDTGDYEYLPKLSPDGLRIAYIAYANGRQIFIMDSDGSDVEQITDSGYYHGVDWSPDGSKLVVSRSDNSDFPSDIYTMNIDGTNQQNLTNTSSDREGSPDWSQDGTSIVYESYLSGNANIFTINPDGSNKVQLTSGNSARQPEWSPDGSKIAFVQPDTTNNSNIHIMDADGSNISKLTYSHSSEQSPSWSPDGSKIAFARYNDGHYSIYVFSVAVNDIVSGSYTPSDDISPHWNY